MTEFNNQSPQQRHQHTACNKKSTRVDLTPMVDLGFILITFFVFTAALSQPMAMNLVVPNDKDDSVSDPICESCVLTVVLGSNNAIWYYEGKEKYNGQGATNYSPSGIRNLIQQKKKKVLQRKGSDQFVLIIKPMAEASFKNLVDMVDECTINMVKRYYIDEVNDAEIKWLTENK